MPNGYTMYLDPRARVSFAVEKAAEAFPEAAQYLRSLARACPSRVQVDEVLRLGRHFNINGEVGDLHVTTMSLAAVQATARAEGAAVRALERDGYYEQSIPSEPSAEIYVLMDRSDLVHVCEMTVDGRTFSMTLSPSEFEPGATEFICQVDPPLGLSLGKDLYSWIGTPQAVQSR